MLHLCQTFRLWLTHKIYDWKERGREKGRLEGFTDVNFSPGQAFPVICSLLHSCPCSWLACSFHYPGHVALLRLLAAQLSSPLIGFRYIKPPGQGAILPIKHSIFSTPLKAGGVRPALRMVIGYLFKLPQVVLLWFWQGGRGGAVPFLLCALKVLWENVCSLLLDRELAHKHTSVWTPGLRVTVGF